MSKLLIYSHTSVDVVNALAIKRPIFFQASFDAKLLIYSHTSVDVVMLDSDSEKRINLKLCLDFETLFELPAISR
jgi:hypothetical protein